jgi:hypothetical protein
VRTVVSTVAWVIAGILALDLLIVVGFVAVEVVGRRRVQREISHLNALWRAPARSPALQVRVGARSDIEEPPERGGRTSLVVRSVTAPRTIGTVAFVTALVAMLVMGVVASVGGEGVRGRTATRADGGNPADEGTSRQGDSEATPTADTRPRPARSPHGNPILVTPGSPPATGSGSVPAKVSAHAASADSILVVWTEVPGASEYQVERKGEADADGWGILGMTSAGETTYRDSAVESDTTYFYRVSAVIDDETAPPSDVISATTPVAPPSATSVSAAAASSSEIALSWTDVAGETGYRIERQGPGASWTSIATTGADITTYTDGGLTSETTYSYRVFAVNEGGDSEASEVVDATTPPPPGPTESPEPGSGADAGPGTDGIDAPGKSKGNPDKPGKKDDTAPPDASTTG